VTELILKLAIIGENADISSEECSQMGAPSECHDLIWRNIRREARRVIEEAGVSFELLEAYLEGMSHEEMERIEQEAQEAVFNPFEPPPPEFGPLTKEEAEEEAKYEAYCRDFEEDPEYERYVFESSILNLVKEDR